MSSQQARGLTEGMLWGAAAALVTAYLPGLASLIWALPIVVVVVRYDLLTGLWSLLVAWLLLTVLSGPTETLTLVVQFGSLGLVYGYYFKEGATAGRTLQAGLLVAVAFTALVLFLPVDFLESIRAGWAEQYLSGVDHTMESYRQIFSGTNAGFTKEAAQQMLSMLDHWMRALFAGSMIVNDMLIAALNFIAARWMLKKLLLPVRPLPSFRMWQLPWYYVWGFILGLGLALLSDYLKWDAGKNSGINIIYVYLPVLFVNGMAVAAFYWKKLPALPMLRIVIILTSFFYFPILVIGLLLLGLFDPLFDYRKIRGKGVEEK
ncbi:MAG: DUF2232 domain-containing protein [Bacillota bacterium]